MPIPPRPRGSRTSWPGTSGTTNVSGPDGAATGWGDVRSVSPAGIVPPSGPIGPEGPPPGDGSSSGSSVHASSAGGSAPTDPGRPTGAASSVQSGQVSHGASPGRGRPHLGHDPAWLIVEPPRCPSSPQDETGRENDRPDDAMDRPGDANGARISPPAAAAWSRSIVATRGFSTERR